MLVTVGNLGLRILSNPIANAVQKILSGKYCATLINLYSYLFLSVMAGIFAFTGNVNPFSYGFEVFCYSALAGVLCTLGSVCLIKALHYGEMSVLAPLNSYKCIVGLVIAFFILGEIPDIIELLGVIFIIFGSWFIFDTVDEGFSFKLLKRKDIILRFCALFFTGCEAVVLKKIILLSSVSVCFVLWCFWGFVFSLLLMFLLKIKFELLSLKDISQTLVIAICLGVMQYSTNVVFKRLDVGLSLALFQLSGIVSVFFGYKFFKERDMFKKIVGSVIMIAGTFFILL